MTQDLEQGTVPAGIVQPKKRFFSVVWLIPVTALLIGIWLAYNTISSKGPVVTIQFRNADGLEAGKTKVKYKNVEVGLVEKIHLDEALSKVVLEVQFNREITPFLTDQTRFWVVRARLGTKEVSGLGTLLSGAYISMDPVREGKRVDSFIGLESTPVVTMDTPGRFFKLKADNLGSLHEGSPVFYRRIQVGHLVSYKLPDKGKSVDIRIFINTPHHKKIFTSTRFWNAGGLEVNISSSGIQLKTESVISLLSGGIAFENIETLDPGSPAIEDTVFRLYSNRSKIDEPRYTQQKYNILKFKESIRGLKVGAPVEFKGYRIGEVVDIKLVYAGKENNSIEIQSSVLIVTEPQRIAVEGVKKIVLDEEEIYRRLIDNGLRAQLKSGMILTGQLYVDLDFYPNAPPVMVSNKGPYREIPTINNSMEKVPDKLAVVLDQLTRIPFEEIGNEALQIIQNLNRMADSGELQQSLALLEKSMVNLESMTAHLKQISNSAEASRSIIALDKSLANFESLSQHLNHLAESRKLDNSLAALEVSMKNLSQLSNKLNTQLTVSLGETLDQGKQTLKAAEHALGGDSTTIFELTQTLQNLSEAARSVSELAEFLEQHPEALLQGKGVN